jgi:hypothetical protein
LRFFSAGEKEASVSLRPGGMPIIFDKTWNHYM